MADSTTSTGTATTTTQATTELVVDKDALEIGQLIKAAGFGKDDVNGLTSSAVSLASLQNLINNNPTEFLSTFEKVNPDAARKFHEQLADEYVKRYATQNDGSDSKDDKSKDLMTEIKLLKERLNATDTAQAQRDQAAMMAQTKARYDARVDEVFGSEEFKKIGLTKAETKALRARLDTDIARDPSAVERAAKGNFVDVPNKFKAIIEEWTSDKTSAIEAEKKARDESRKKAMGEFATGPNPFMPIDIPTDAADSWDKTESAFAKALGQFEEK